MKKIVSIIISVIIFIGLVASIAGLKLLAIIGLIAHSVHSVWLYGRDWEKREVKQKGVIHHEPVKDVPDHRVIIEDKDDKKML